MNNNKIFLTVIVKLCDLNASMERYEIKSKVTKINFFGMYHWLRDTTIRRKILFLVFGAFGDQVRDSIEILPLRDL